MTKPVLVRKDTLRAFEWRVRNLPYTFDNFELSVDSTTQQIVIRTRNKKYFKRLDIPDIKRHEPSYTLESSRLDWSFKNSTLVVSYSKPDFILVREATMREEFIKLNKKNPREGEIECTYQ